MQSKETNRIRFSIRTKLLVSILGVVLFFGSIHVYVIWRIVHETLEHEFFKKGVMLTQHLAYQLEEAVLYDDVPSVQRLLWQWKSDAREHGYALVVSSNGGVIASTFVNGVPVGLVEANMPSGSVHQIMRIRDVEEPYLDVAVPLLGGETGWVRLGLHEKPVQVPVGNLLRLLLGMILFFIVIGIIGAVVFSRMITSPIKKIMKGIGSVNLESDPVKLEIHSRDEIEVLSDSFEEMTNRLQKSHQQLTEANRKGYDAQKLAEVGLLASGIAHEINNPLAGIELGLRRIAKDPENVTQNVRYIPPMMESLEHMQHVIRQLLLFARPDSLNFNSISIAEMIDRALLLVHHKLTKHNIKVINSNGEETEKVWADPQSITQILVNLMMNAADAMPNGGELIIETERKDGRTHIWITDTGCGIDKEHLDRIWEPFFTTKEVGKGTGLGLSVTKTLVEEMSGSIEVESKNGKGTNFYLSLPSTEGSR
jgi:signal transduction histidine kinase